jgi:hypothetical protein
VRRISDPETGIKMAANQRNAHESYQISFLIRVFSRQFAARLLLPLFFHDADALFQDVHGDIRLFLSQDERRRNAHGIFASAKE